MLPLERGDLTQTRSLSPPATLELHVPVESLHSGVIVALSRCSYPPLTSTVFCLLCLNLDSGLCVLPHFGFWFLFLIILEKDHSKIKI